jgi:hypothetical protein
LQILLADQRNTQSNFSLTYNGWKKIIRMCSWSNGDILIRMKIDDLKANITDVTKSADCVVELTVVLFRQTWLFKEDFVCVRWRKAAVMMFLLTFKSYRIKLLLTLNHGGKGRTPIVNRRDCINRNFFFEDCQMVVETKLKVVKSLPLFNQKSFFVICTY